MIMNSVKDIHGQAALLTIVFLSMIIVLTGSLFKISIVVREKIRLQIASDLALLSALNTQCNSLNAIAIGNRAILAHEAFSAQLNAMVSESTFNRKMIESFGRLIRFIPGYGPVLASALGKGGRFIVGVIRKAASILIPTASTLNRTINLKSYVIRKTLPVNSLKSAKDSLRITDPGANIIVPAQLQYLHRTVSLANKIKPLDQKNFDYLIHNTLDHRTKTRNWTIGSGIFSLPIKKSGSTRIKSDDYRSFDVLKIKTFKRLRWNWKSVLSASSAASEFSYKRTGEILNFVDDIPKSHTIVLKKKLTSQKQVLPHINASLLAVSSGEIYFHRPNRPDEEENLLNPFWFSRLIPVRDEESAKKLVPDVLLREIRH